jgi:hypothetical protein
MAKASGAKSAALNSSHFPICETPAEFWKRDNDGALKQGSGAAKASILPATFADVVHSVQAFRSETWLPLVWLQRVNNTDKHRRANLAMTAHVGTALTSNTEVGPVQYNP